MKGIGVSDLLIHNINKYYQDYWGITKRLSSALKLNSSADDPAYMARLASEKANEHGILTSIQNISEGISMIQTMDGSLQDIQDAIVRIRDLAVRAANDAVLRDDCHDRTRLNNEAQALIDEVDRQARESLFQGKKLLQGDYLENIESTAGTDNVVIADTPEPVSWVDNDTIAATLEVEEDPVGTIPPVRPGNTGDTTYRIFTQDIETDPANPGYNGAKNSPVQLTDDPSAISDPDVDGYYDNGSNVNDPQPNDFTYPANDADTDLPAADGWPLLVDNDDTDATETGTALDTLNADLDIPTTTSYVKDESLVTWANAVTRTFTEGTVDTVSVDVDNTIGTYKLQLHDRDPLSATFDQWVTVYTGAGAGPETHDLGADYIADGVRVVVDDDVQDITGLVTIAAGTNEIYNDVEFSAEAVSTPPETYRIDIGPGPAQDINTIELQAPAGVNYELYADDGSGPTSVLTSTGTGAIQTHTGLSLTNPTTFYVELLDGTGAVSNFDAYLDETKGLGAAAAIGPPYTTKYTVTGAGQDINEIEVQVTGGVNYTIYYDDGSGPTSLLSSIGTGAVQTHNFADLTNPTAFYVELDAAGAVSNFQATLVTNAALGAAADSGPVDHIFIPLGPADEVDVETSNNHRVYADGALVGSGAGGVLQNYAFAPAAVITVEMDDPAGTVTQFDAYNGGFGLVSGQSTVDRGVTYTLGGAADHLEIQVNAGVGYEVFVDGASQGYKANAGGALETFDFAQVAAGTTVEVVVDRGYDASTEIASILAEDIEDQTTSSGSGAHVFQYNVTPADKDVTHVDLDLAAGLDYKIYDDTYPAGPITSGTSAAGVEEIDLGGSYNTNYLVLELDLGYDTSSVNSIAAREVTRPGTGAPAASNRFYKYDIDNNPQRVNHIDLDINAGIDYTIYDDSGGTIRSATSVGAESFDFAAVSTDYIMVELELGATTADINSLSATSEISLGAASDSFADIDAANSNVAVYSFNIPAPPDNAYTEFDELEFTVKDTHDYTFQYSNDGGTTWTTLLTGTGDGNPVTWQVENDPGQADEVQADSVRIVLNSGNDTQSGEATLTRVTNRMDRDGDGWPDSIEDFNGADPDNIADIPFSAAGATGGPDDDGDGFVDYPTYFDTAEVDFTASTNPFGFDWTDGSGNRLDVDGGQYQLVSGTITDVPANEVPSNIDTDGDTLPDPLDPFDTKPEFATWLDGEGAYKGAGLLFISNRATPDQAAQKDLYVYQGGTYTRVTTSGTAEDPAFSQDGTSGAWVDGGNINTFFLSSNCGSTSVNWQPVITTGDAEAPTWSPDNSKVAFVRGGNIFVATVPDGTETDLQITGDNPDWSPDGDNLVYSKGGQLYAYNFVTEQEYDLGLAGDNPVWSPDMTKIAYKSGNTARVTDLTIEYRKQPLQVGSTNTGPDSIDFSFPDARASKIGLTSINIVTQEGAEAGIASADSAIEQVSDFRAEVGTVYNTLMHTLNDLSTYRINLAASRSLIEDADMAMEYTDMVRVKILSEGANAAAIHGSRNLENHVKEVINRNVQDQSLKARRTPVSAAHAALR